MVRLTKGHLGALLRRIMGKHSAEIAKIAVESQAKTFKEFMSSFKEKDQEMALEFTSAILKELSRMGVDLSSIWHILEKNNLTEWADE